MELGAFRKSDGNPCFGCRMGSIMKRTSIAILSFLFVAAFTVLPLSVSGDAVAEKAAKAMKGDWIKKQYPTKGNWKIVNEAGVNYIELSGDFETKNAPDVKIFISKKDADSLTSKNAAKGTQIARIKKTKSDGKVQRFEIPKEIDPSQFKSLALHCQKYSVLFAVGKL